MNERLTQTKLSLTAFFTAASVVLGWKGLLVLAWALLMALDYLTGTFAAMKGGAWCSRKAREGAWHKAGTIIVVLVSAIGDGILAVVCGNIPLLNIRWPGLLLPLILAWYILTELGSILENAIALGAQAPAWLTGILETTLKAVNDLGEKAIND